MRRRPTETEGERSTACKTGTTEVLDTNRYEGTHGETDTKSNTKTETETTVKRSHVARSK